MKPRFRFLQKTTKPSRSRGFWSWQRFWLAFSFGALLIIGFVALLQSIRQTLEVEEEPEPLPVVALPQIFETPESHQRLPDLLNDRPTDRPPPEAVNEFLREEQGLNASRLELLRQRQVNIEPLDFTSRCLPQWDFRSIKREVIWFYHYRSGATPDGRPLTVFGAVDGLGQPLFQHPSMAGDPLALLDSQYVALKWVALEEPRMALIAASNGPWEESGAVVDIFLVNRAASRTGPHTWRFDDASYPEQPRTSARLICFLDANGDGLRDLCAYWLTGEVDEAQPKATATVSSPKTRRFP